MNNTLTERQTNRRTGYPSLDKPWLKYFSKEAINTPLPRGKNLYDNVYDNNKDHLSDIALAFDVNDGNECKYNTSGEICISGPGVMLKYLGNDDYTREVIKEHDGRRWMHTGDIGHIDEDGCVFIEGRMKRMIIRYDGFKVFPTKVEDVLSKVDKVELCCCVAKDDENHDSGQLPVVFVVPKSGTDHSVIEVELERISNARLPEYSRPSKFYFIDSLPMTNANKVDYRELESIAKGK